MFDPGNVIQLTVGRTYNIGNYESLRADLTVSVPPDRELSQVFEETSKELDRITASARKRR